MRYWRAGRYVVALTVVVASTLVVGVGPASAAVSFSATPTSGLSDGQSIQITAASLNAVPFATVEISQCANAYADGTPLASLNKASDCKVLGGYDVSTTPTLVTDIAVSQTGIGTGDRSCIHTNEAMFPCDVRISQMKNQMVSTLPAPVAIEFADDALGGSAGSTTTTAAAVGNPIAFGKTAWAHVVVEGGRLDSQGRPFIPEGDVVVDVDGSPAGSATLTPGLANGHATASVPMGSPSIGTDHHVVAHFQANGSFAASDSSSSPFDIIETKNVTIGDVTALEGDPPAPPAIGVAIHTMVFPVVLSVPDPVNVVTVGYAIHGVSATVGPKTTAGTDVVIATGTLRFALNGTTRYVTARVVGDTAIEGPETFTVDLSPPSNGYVLRRGQGTGTILDDDASTSGLEVGLGEASGPEGDVGGVLAGLHAVRVPITLSQAQPSLVTVQVQLTSNDAIRARFGDWAGPIVRNVKFYKNQVSKAVSISMWPDMNDEPNLHVNIKILSTTAGTIVRDTGTATILTDE